MKTTQISLKFNWPAMVWLACLGGIAGFATAANAATPTTIRLVSKSSFDGYRMSARFQLVDQAGQPVVGQRIKVTAEFNGRGVKGHCKTYSNASGYFRCRVNSRWSHPADHAEMIVDFFGDDQYQRTQLRVNWPRVTGS